MKAKYLLLMCFVVGSTYGQVGINTTLPLQSFHIDGKKDNPPGEKPNATQEANDVVVDINGNVGIGTITPTSKLDVRGNSSFGGVVDINGVTSFNKEVQIEKVSGEKGAYLVSQGAGKAPTWYVPKPSQQGDMTNVKEYSFMMLDANGGSTVVNVDELFQKYLKTLTIPSVEFYASSTGKQSLTTLYNKINVFKSELPVSKHVSWDNDDKCIIILTDGKYLFTMQIGFTVLKSVINANPTILDNDILIGFTKKDPTIGTNTTDLWVGRGVYRMSVASGSEARGFTSYSTLLELKKGDKIYPITYITAQYGDNVVTIEGVQTGSAGNGVLTNLNVTKY